MISIKRKTKLLPTNESFIHLFIPLDIFLLLHTEIKKVHKLKMFVHISWPVLSMRLLVFFCIFLFFFFWIVHLKHSIVQSLKAKCFFFTHSFVCCVFVATISLTMVYFLFISYKISFPEIMLGKSFNVFFLFSHFKLRCPDFEECLASLDADGGGGGVVWEIRQGCVLGYVVHTTTLLLLLV